MITFETESGLKIRVGGKTIKESHTRLINFFKDLKKFKNNLEIIEIYEELQAIIDKHEIDLDAV